MAWGRLDDTFHAHPKVRSAGLEAIGLHARAMSFSAAYMKDGHIESEWVDEVAGKRGQQIAQRLVHAGLWEPNGTGWHIHDYLEYNWSKEQILAKREADAKRKSGRK